jgi:hypothetical protein
MAALTQEEKDEKMIMDIEQRIEGVLELLGIKNKVNDIDEEVTKKRKVRHASKNNKELTWCKGSKSNNIAITKHSQGNMELIEAIKTKKKFSEHPEDLLKHLDTLTDRLLTVIERQCESKRK